MVELSAVKQKMVFKWKSEPWDTKYFLNPIPESEEADLYGPLVFKYPALVDTRESNPNFSKIGNEVQIRNIIADLESYVSEKTGEQRKNVYEMSDSELEDIISGTGDVESKNRKIVRERVGSLSHHYHNLEHTLTVGTNLGILIENLKDPNIIKHRDLLLLSEVYWRHDDDHSGLTFMQDCPQEVQPEVSADDYIIYGFVRRAAGFEILNEFKNKLTNISNEEKAAYNAVVELFGRIPLNDLIFIIRHILSSAFAQSNVEKLSQEKTHYFRPYQPTSDTEKLFVLADVGVALYGEWKDFLQDNINLLYEQPGDEPISIQEWAKLKIGFLAYVREKLIAVKHLVTEDFYQKSAKNITRFKWTFTQLKDYDPNDLTKIEEYEYRDDVYLAITEYKKQ